MSDPDPSVDANAELASHPLSFHPELLAGRTVLVTGAGSGIGRATAWLCARLGARVLLAGRTAAKLDVVTTALRTSGLQAETVTVDIREPDSVDAAFERVDALGALPDLLVNCAGGQFPQPALEFSEKGWNAVVNTNLNGTWRMMQRAAQRWRTAGRPGSIVTLVVVPRGLHGVAHTCAARAGVIALSEALAVEWAEYGIRVNCIAPGVIKTEGWKVYPDHIRARYANTNPLLSTGTPWLVAEAIVFVGGPSGRFITGDVLTIDGGGRHWGEIWTTGKPPGLVEASRSWDDSGGD